MRKKFTKVVLLVSSCLPNRHGMILNSLDGLLVIKKQFRMVFTMVESVYKLMLRWRELEQTVKIMDDCGFGLFIVNPFLLAKNGDKRCSNMTIQNRLDGFEKIGELGWAGTTNGQIK